MTTKTHGGNRPGAGRPKKPAKQAEAIQVDLTPMAHLLGVMRNPAQSQARRMRAAALLMPYMHPKFGCNTVKDAAQFHGQGRFPTPPPPKPH